MAKFGEVRPRTLYISTITVLTISLVAMGISLQKQDTKIKALKKKYYEQRQKLSECSYENRLCKTLLRGN